MVIAMGCKTIPEQLAVALKKDTVLTTDRLPIVTNSTLYDVTVGNLITSFGLTGSITSADDGGAAAILAGAAPNYTIRGVKGGDGITAQLNVNGNITINQNVGNAGGASAGTGIVKNTTGARIDFKRLKAGEGISLTSDANSITITNSLADPTTSQIVTVASLSDLPSPVSGVITLADDTLYNFVNSIASTNRFVIGSNTLITSPSPFTIQLTYTGSGNMFTFGNGFAGIRGIGIACPNGTLFDSSAVTSGTLLCDFLLVSEVKNLGTLKHGSIGLYSWFTVLHTGSGFQYLAATSARLRMNNMTFRESTDPTAVMVDLNGATFDALDITAFQNLNTAAGQKFLKGTAGGANMTAGQIGYVSQCTIKGDMVGLDTISVNDPGWDFYGNNKIADTDPHAVLSLDAPATTTITVAGTPVQVNGAFTATAEQVYSVSAAGVVTYNGRRDKFARIDVTMSFEPSSGTNKNLFVQIAKNGTVIGVTKISRVSNAGTSTVTSVDWGVQLSDGDTIAIFVGNDSDTTNILVNQMLLRVS